MVAGMWWFFTLIMISSYTANLAGELAAKMTGDHLSVYDNSLDCSLPHILQDGLTYQLGRGSCKADENKIRHLLLRLHEQLLLSEFILSSAAFMQF